MSRNDKINEIRSKIMIALASLDRSLKGEKVTEDELKKSAQALKEASSQIDQLDGGYFV